MKKIKLINCVVINHITGNIEVAPFIEVEGNEVARKIDDNPNDPTGVDGAASFSQFVTETERTVHEVFFGKECETIFDEDKKKIVVRNKTDNIDIVTINIDVRDFVISK